MACTNCKNNSKKKTDQLRAGVDSVFNSVDSSIDEQKLKLGDKLLSGSASILNIYEKIGVTILGWVPLSIGYYIIVKFIISLF